MEEEKRKIEGREGKEGGEKKGMIEMSYARKEKMMEEGRKYRTEEKSKERRELRNEGSEREIESTREGKEDGNERKEKGRKGRREGWKK